MSESTLWAPLLLYNLPKCDLFSLKCFFCHRSRGGHMSSLEKVTTAHALHHDISVPTYQVIQLCRVNLRVITYLQYDVSAQSLYHPIREGNLLLISYKPPFPLSAEQLIDLARLHSGCCLLLTMGAAGGGDGDVETRRRFAAPPKFRIFFPCGRSFCCCGFRSRV